MIREVFLEDSLLRADPSGGRFQRLCSYGTSMAREGTLLRATLAASGVIAPGRAIPREFIGQALKELVMHEVGHTLGLRHNFRGTAAIPMEKLFDRVYTAAHGTSASVMDYNPPAIALDRSKQGDYYSRTIGRSEEHTSELQSPCNLVCRLLLEKKKKAKPEYLDPQTTRIRPPQLAIASAYVVLTKSISVDMWCVGRVSTRVVTTSSTAVCRCLYCS